MRRGPRARRRCHEPPGRSQGESRSAWRGGYPMSGTALASLDPQAPLAQHLLEARKLARRAAAVLLVGVVPVCAWMAFAPLSAAVVATSFVKVDLDRRVVQ